MRNESLDGAPRTEMNEYLTEACVETLDAAILAYKRGADRIELCQNLDDGGITPSFSLLEDVVGALWKLAVEGEAKKEEERDPKRRQLGEVEDGLTQYTLRRFGIMVMVRPRSGNFVYGDDEVLQMLRTIRRTRDYAKKSNHYSHYSCRSSKTYVPFVQGVVFGALKEDNTIDVPLCRALASEAFPLQCTFHKAFDDTPDLMESLRVLQCIPNRNINRVLTSGGKLSASEGATTLKELVANAEALPPGIDDDEDNDEDNDDDGGNDDDNDCGDGHHAHHVTVIAAGKITLENIQQIHKVICATEYHGRKIVFSHGT